MVAMLARGSAETDPRHGQAPADRSLAQHLRLGAVNLDKPSGPTSHQVAAWLKDALQVEKAGHGGTLDPNVTGVLPVALLDATRVVKTLLEAPKEYVCVLQTRGDIPEKRLRDAFERFRGPVYQMPPLKSAVKRQLRVRTLYELEILEVSGRQALFRVACEAGTYIRKLCTDVGTVAGVGAQMLDLRRTRTGPFTEAETVTLHDLKDAHAFWQADGDEAELRRVVRPVEELVAHLPRVDVRDGAVDALCHGAPLGLPGVARIDERVKEKDLVAVFTLKGELVSVGAAAMDAKDVIEHDHGVAVAPGRVVMQPGTYPRGWSKRDD